MIRHLSKCLLILILSVSTAVAQYNTGDNELNRNLVNIDVEAKMNFGAFKADLSSSYNVTNKQIDHLSATVGMSAGDIYMTVRIAKILSISIERVVSVYQVHHGKGWGVMAKELGIKPGSAEFHALKGNGNKKGNSSKKPGHPKGKRG